MKRIVDGRLYDTDGATVVCSWHETVGVCGTDVGVDFMLYRENVAEKPLEGLKLYSWGGVSDQDVKKDASKGVFFLATSICGDKGRIRPVGVDEARRIFEEHTTSDYCLEDEYEKYFGIRPVKPILGQLKEAFAAGAAAKQKQYEEKEAERKRKAEEDS